MYSFRAFNTNQLFPTVVSEMLRRLDSSTMSGPASNLPLILPSALTVSVDNPIERLVFWDRPTCDPGYDLIYALWVVAGRCDVEPLSCLRPQVASISDDGKVINGAYGHRLRREFEVEPGSGIDQIRTVANSIRTNPGSMRHVLSLWDPRTDIGSNSLSLPKCTHAYFRVDDGLLNMSVCARASNVVDELFGTDFWCFSLVQELVAALSGTDVGSWTYFCDAPYVIPSKHGHLKKRVDDYVKAYGGECPYKKGHVKATPVVNRDDPLRWLSEVEMLLDEGPSLGMTDPFVRQVAAPIARVVSEYQNESGVERFDRILKTVDRIEADDWKARLSTWYQKRRDAELEFQREHVEGW